MGLKSILKTRYFHLQFYLFSVTFFRHAVSGVINLYNFGCSVVTIILLSEITEDLLHEHVHINKCIWMLIYGAVLTPISWLGTPKEFW